jgi:alkanesulfonate monooxygenase SsuD/methylene tetrahydromethanopterin reductase-like flavin-dependent oxidoreductase (luciferase family)
LAAETAEVVFCSPKDIEGARVLYADIKGRTAKAGRNPEHLKILPAALIIVGETKEDAQEKRLRLDSLAHSDSAVASLSIALGTDVSKYDLDGFLPEDLPETNASHTARAAVLALAEKEGLTIRQLASRYGGYAGLAFVGTAESIADEFELWLKEEAADGFTVCFPFLPEGLDNITKKLIPELQQRGLFRSDYKGSTLREHLGLPRPKNRFFEE